MDSPAWKMLSQTLNPWLLPAQCGRGLPGPKPELSSKERS